jgi:hypothetical protein
MGSQDAALSRPRAAAHSAVRSTRTWRGDGWQVATTVMLASTIRQPAALGLPKLPRRPRMPRRMVRPAPLFVGSTPV